MDIICWAFPGWEGDYMKSTVQLMKELSVRHRVLYIDYAYSLKDVFYNRFKNKYIPVSRILKPGRSLMPVELPNGGKVHVLSLPPVLPYNWTSTASMFDKVQAFNKRLVLPRIRKAIRTLGFKDPVLINAFNPFFGPEYKALLGAGSLVYYCYDNIGAAAWANRHGGRLEKRLMDQADATVFTSDALRSSRSIPGKPARVITNGVDLTAYHSLPDGYEVKEEKNIVFVGSIDQRLDFNLLRQLCLSMPEHRFHFVGRIMDPRAEILRNLTNTTFYGPIDPHDIPALMAGMDAGIIPFVTDEFTRCIFPMKLYEYLAAGLPVVMTGFARLQGFGDLVFQSDGTEEFRQGLIHEMMTSTQDKIKRRKALAHQNSWEMKAMEFEKFLTGNG